MPGITNSKNKFHGHNLSLAKEACCPIQTVDWRADCLYRAKDICIELMMMPVIIFV